VISKQKRSRRAVSGDRSWSTSTSLRPSITNSDYRSSPPSSHRLYLASTLSHRHLRFLQSDLFNLASLAPRSLSLSRSSVRAINSARSIHTTTTVVSARRTLVTIGSRQNALNTITPSRRLDQVSPATFLLPCNLLQLDSIRRG
jgi:hypothetical protein